MSARALSNLNKKIYAKIEAWRNRRIEGDHLHLDGIVMKRNWAGEVRNVSLLVASAVNSEGFCDILGIYEGAKEDKSGSSAFLRHLIDRGLKGVQLVISDACRGLVDSVADFLPQARYQCISIATSSATSLRPGFARSATCSRQFTPRRAARPLTRKPRQTSTTCGPARWAKAADLVEQAVHERLTYYGFPDIHWQKIRTNNPLKRIMKDQAQNSCGRRLPDGWQLHAYGTSPDDVVRQMLHEYAVTLSATPI